MKIKQQTALALVAHALAEKVAHVGVKVFINNTRPASDADILLLLAELRQNTDGVRNAYKDERGYWHFATLA